MISSATLLRFLCTLKFKNSQNPEQAILFLLRFRVSRAGIFSDLSTGEHRPLRIPVLRKKRPEDLAAASPTDKSRKYEALPTVMKKKEHILYPQIAVSAGTMFTPS
jgi:hypothetical protein